MFLAISLSAYVAALGSALYGFFQGAHTARRWTVGLTLTGFLAHLCAVVQRGITARGFPVTNLSESLLFFGLVLMVVHLFLRLTLKQRGTTLFFLGFVAGLLTAAVLLQPPGGPETGGTIHPWIVLHITTSFLGYGAFFLTFVSSLMYLIADYQLKHRRVTRFY